MSETRRGLGALREVIEGIDTDLQNKQWVHKENIKCGLAYDNNNKIYRVRFIFISC